MDAIRKRLEHLVAIYAERKKEGTQPTAWAKAVLADIRSLLVRVDELVKDRDASLDQAEMWRKNVRQMDDECVKHRRELDQSISSLHDEIDLLTRERDEALAENKRFRAGVLMLGGGRCNQTCLWHEGDCHDQREAQCDALEGVE